MKILDIEIRIASWFNYRQNIIVPNISWGADLHECDMLIIRRSGYAIEVEIKTSFSDLKKDKEKKHQHKSNRIKELWFAMPYPKKDEDKWINEVPEHAGILFLNEYEEGKISINTIRQPMINKNAHAFTDLEILNIARLGTMRIWNLKRTVCNFLKK